MSVNINNLQVISGLQATDTVLVDTNSVGTGIATVESVSQFMKDIFLSGGVPYGKELTESWSDLQARIKAGNFSGIHIGDYKTITLTTGEKVVMEVAGIDQYYKCGDTTIGHHIDFISRDCLAGTKQFNTTNTNNGTETEPNPWRASALFSTLNNTVYGTLPSDLKACIIQKRALLESRYASSGALTAPSGWAWNNMGNLWIPTEVEVFGMAYWSHHGYGTAGGGCNLQYPIFKGGAKHIIKGAGNGGGRCYWWEASANSGNSSNVCYVNNNGNANNNNASNTNIYAPL